MFSSLLLLLCLCCCFGIFLHPKKGREEKKRALITSGANRKCLSSSGDWSWGWDWSWDRAGAEQWTEAETETVAKTVAGWGWDWASASATAPAPHTGFTEACQGRGSRSRKGFSQRVLIRIQWAELNIANQLRISNNEIHIGSTTLLICWCVYYIYIWIYVLYMNMFFGYFSISFRMLSQQAEANVLSLTKICVVSSFSRVFFLGYTGCAECAGYTGCSVCSLATCVHVVLAQSCCRCCCCRRHFEVILTLQSAQVNTHKGRLRWHGEGDRARLPD